MHYRREIVGDGNWPAVVDRETYETAIAILYDPRRKTTYRRTRLLTGILVDTHGRKLGSQPHGGVPAYRVLRDDIHPGVYIDAKAAEEFVIEAVLARTDDQQLPDAEPGTSPTSRLAALEAEMAELVAYRERDEIRLSEFVALQKPLRAAIDEERARLPSMVDRRWQRPGALRAAWPELTDSQRKAALRDVLERAEVRPRQRGDKPEHRVSIHFKH
jgi:hypothetical protein